MFNVKFEYEVIEVQGKSVNFNDRTTHDAYDVPLNIIRNNVQCNCRCTCHTMQGSTVRESITSFDYKFYFVSGKRLWIAIARAHNLDDALFYDYSEEKEFNLNLIRCYFKNKVKGYKQHDHDATREIDEQKELYKC